MIVFFFMTNGHTVHIRLMTIPTDSLSLLLLPNLFFLPNSFKPPSWGKTEIKEWKEETRLAVGKRKCQLSKTRNAKWITAVTTFISVKPTDTTFFLFFFQLSFWTDDCNRFFYTTKYFFLFCNAVFLSLLDFFLVILRLSFFLSIFFLFFFLLVFSWFWSIFVVYPSVPCGQDSGWRKS